MASLHLPKLRKSHHVRHIPLPSLSQICAPPTNDSGATELIITNIMGEVIEQHKIAPHTNQIEINTFNLPNGTYLYQLKNQAGSIGINKLLVLHY